MPLPPPERVTAIGHGVAYHVDVRHAFAIAQLEPVHPEAQREARELAFYEELRGLGRNDVDPRLRRRLEIRRMREGYEEGEREDAPHWAFRKQEH